MVEQSLLLSHMWFPHPGTDNGFSLSGSSLPQPCQAAGPMLRWHPVEAKNMTVTLGQVRGASLVVLVVGGVTRLAKEAGMLAVLQKLPPVPHPVQL